MGGGRPGQRPPPTPRRSVEATGRGRRQVAAAAGAGGSDEVGADKWEPGAPDRAGCARKEVVPGPLRVGLVMGRQ